MSGGNTTEQYVAYNELSTVGRDDQLSTSVVGINDAAFLGNSETPWVPNESAQFLRNFRTEYVDVQALSPPTSLSGQQVRFLFGKEGYALCESVELVCEWPGFGQIAAAAGTDSFNSCYANWLGYRILGGSSSSAVKMMYGNQDLRMYSAECLYHLHNLNTVYNSIQEAEWVQMAGKSPGTGADAGKPITTTIKLDIPWGGCDGSKKNKPLVAAALSDYLQLTFTLPKFSDVIEADTYTFGVNYGVAAPTAFANGISQYKAAQANEVQGWSNLVLPAEAITLKWDPSARILPAVSGYQNGPSGLNVYLRVRGVSLEKAERASYAQKVIMGGGLRYINCENELQLANDISPLASPQPGNATITTSVKITQLRNPSVYILAIVRCDLDSQPAQPQVAGVVLPAGASIAASIAALGPTAFTSQLAYQQMRFASMPISYYEVLDNSKRVGARRTQKYNRLDLDKYGFEYNILSQPGYAIMPFCRWALNTTDGLGHETMTDYANPSFRINFNVYPFALPTTRALATAAHTFATPTANEVGDDKNSYLFCGDGKSDRLANLLGGIRANVTDITTLGAAFTALRFSVDLHSRSRNRFEHEAGRMLEFFRTS